MDAILLQHTALLSVQTYNLWLAMEDSEDLDVSQFDSLCDTVYELQKLIHSMGFETRHNITQP